MQKANLLVPKHNLHVPNYKTNLHVTMHKANLHCEGAKKPSEVVDGTLRELVGIEKVIGRQLRWCA